VFDRAAATGRRYSLIPQFWAAWCFFIAGELTKDSQTKNKSRALRAVPTDEVTVYASEALGKAMKALMWSECAKIGHDSSSWCSASDAGIQSGSVDFIEPAATRKIVTQDAMLRAFRNSSRGFPL